jgi:hypothetical protein
MYTLQISFNTMEELSEFILAKKIKEDIKKEKKIGDRRGLNVSCLHKNAREYHLEHPEVPYKMCLKLGNSSKEIDINAIEPEN